METLRWPRFLQEVFSSPRYAWLWLFLRVWLGLQWLDAGWHKITGHGWLWFDNGTTLRGFWERAVAVPEKGTPPITYGWYRDFLNLLLDHNANEWFGSVVAIGELAIGLALIFGALTGIAALAGWFMNINFLLAGSSSVNPVFATVGALLILAYPVAGYWGADKWLLPKLGTPWAKTRLAYLRGAGTLILHTLTLALGGFLGALAMEELFASDFLNELLPLRSAPDAIDTLLGWFVGIISASIALSCSKNHKKTL